MKWDVFHPLYFLEESYNFNQKWRLPRGLAYVWWYAWGSPLGPWPQSAGKFWVQVAGSWCAGWGLSRNFEDGAGKIPKGLGPVWTEQTCQDHSIELWMKSLHLQRRILPGVRILLCPETKCKLKQTCPFPPLGCSPSCSFFPCIP